MQLPIITVRSASEGEGAIPHSLQYGLFTVLVSAAIFELYVIESRPVAYPLVS